jgi:hypothetical protein
MAHVDCVMVEAMTDERRDGEGEIHAPSLERLESVVNKRDKAVWRAFVVAQASSRIASRRREMTTQRLFLIGGPEAERDRRDREP